MRSLPVLTLLSVALLGGCVSVAPHGTAPTDGPLPDDSLNATAWYQTSLERNLIYREIYRAAGEHLDSALADKRWDALPRADRAEDHARRGGTHRASRQRH